MIKVQKAPFILKKGLAQAKIFSNLTYILPKLSHFGELYFSSCWHHRPESDTPSNTPKSDTPNEVVVHEEIPNAPPWPPPRSLMAPSAPLIAYELRVHLWSGHDLPAMDSSGNSDPYCTLSMYTRHAQAQRTTSLLHPTQRSAVTSSAHIKTQPTLRSARRPQAGERPRARKGDRPQHACTNRLHERLYESFR